MNHHHNDPDEHILTLSCPDQVGIVAAVASALAGQRWTIIESQQFGDTDAHHFFMRVKLSPVDSTAADAETLRKVINAAVAHLDMTWALHPASAAVRTILMVSKQGHCLNRLLFQAHSGELPIDVVAVVSNHRDWAEEVQWHGIPFHHVPVTPDTKAWAESELLDLMKAYDAELVVLARYMQILSNWLCEQLKGCAINIHHSLLPSFKGARPYKQAHERGVKVIGATAHYVTSDLDEGPIIEQDFTRVDHRASAAELARIGQDLEAMALSRAVAAHAEHRVVLNGTRTVVFA